MMICTSTIVRWSRVVSCVSQVKWSDGVEWDIWVEQSGQSIVMDWVDGFQCSSTANWVKCDVVAKCVVWMEHGFRVKFNNVLPG